ncbi:MAG TPA: HAMP domain-containing sensor histidine kinase [Microthrixaceae bacterium]|nr:HAMP domain-containing sensor histidine kinase [Microthrixaceae bacterium]
MAFSEVNRRTVEDPPRSATTEPRRVGLRARLRSLDRGEQLRFPLAAILLAATITLFAVLDHSVLHWTSLEGGALIAIGGSVATVLAIVVGCVSLMRWRLVGDVTARDLGALFLLLGGAWFVPILVLPTIAPSVDFTRVVAVGCGTVVALAFLSLRTLIDPTRYSNSPTVRGWATTLWAITSLLIGAGFGVLIPASDAEPIDGIMVLPEQPLIAFAVVAAIVPGVAIHRREWLLAWGSLAALGVVAGELFAAGALSPFDSWTVARPVLDATAVTLALIGAGMGLRDAYLDVQYQRDLAERELRATGQQFVAEIEHRRMVSHDTRSSLLAIQGAIGLIEDALNAQRVDTRLAVATRSEVERLCSTMERSAPEPAVVVQIAELITPLVATRCNGTTVRVSIPHGLTATVSPAAAGLVLQNLLDNAARHARRSEIDIVATAGNSQVEIAVMDRGPGVSAAWRDRIFEFGATSHPDGQGIGLHVARTIAVEQAGSLHYEPRPGGGASFVLTLPASRSD